MEEQMDELLCIGKLIVDFDSEFHEADYVVEGEVFKGELDVASEETVDFGEARVDCLLGLLFLPAEVGVALGQQILQVALLNQAHF